MLFFLWLLGVLDITLTAILMYNNIAEEWNPLLLWFLYKGGLAVMILFRISTLSCLISLIAFSIKRAWIQEKLASTYVLVGIMIYAVIVIPAYLVLFF